MSPEINDNQRTLSVLNEPLYTDYKYTNICYDYAFKHSKLWLYFQETKGANSFFHISNLLLFIS